MSWLHFNKDAGKIYLYAGDHPRALVSRMIGTWDAHNDTTISSRGQWPSGMWKWSHYNDHLDDQNGYGPGCFSTAYGCSGIHVFNVPATQGNIGRSGMGVHAGRQNLDKFINNIPGGKTLGCIRTSESALIKINSIHQTDKLKAIIVGNLF